MRFIPFYVLLLLVAGTVVAQDVEPSTIRLSGQYLTLELDEAGIATSMHSQLAQRDLAGPAGLFHEGFGTGSFYVPNRRSGLASRELRMTDRVAGQFVYDCEGANIEGFHVEKRVELYPGESAVVVRLRVENRGPEAQWFAPWVRHHLEGGRPWGVDVPAREGIVRLDGARYVSAARNWAAVTDSDTRTTVYTVFDADQAYALLGEPPAGRGAAAVQGAFVPHVLEQGRAWESRYRVAVVQGLDRVDFATDEFALQVDYARGRLELALAPSVAIPAARLATRLRGQDGQVHSLPDRDVELAPGKVARCVYDWVAPQDGPYELLAQLNVDGKVYELGRLTGSPHGGTDTRFVVGGGDHPFPAWTDAPHALDRGPRRLERTMAWPGDTRVWCEPALRKVFPDDIPVPVGTPRPLWELGLCRGEYESFQIVLRPPEGQDARGVRVRTSDLVNPDAGTRIAAGNVDVRNVVYHPVRIPSRFEGATGLWPDALPPHRPFVAPGGRNTPLWVTVHAPKDTAAGTYTGILELTAADMEPVEITLEATVWDFTLPDTPGLKTDFGFSLEDAWRQCRDAGYQGPRSDLAEAFLKSAFAHRVTLRPFVALPAESPDYRGRLAAFESELDRLLARGATTVAVPESLLETPDQLAHADAFVSRKGLEDRAYGQVAHNPQPPEWPRTLERMQLWFDTAPNIPMLVSTRGLQPFLHDAARIWDVHLQVLDTPANRAVLTRVADGGEVWFHVDHGPPRPYGNLFIDFDAVEHRALFWQAWALGLRGFRYWSVNHVPSGADPYTALADETPANGNGLLLYPGPDGPVESIRWATVRDGLEDFEYLAKLSRMRRELQGTPGREALLRRVESALSIGEFIPNLVEFSRDPQVLMERRRIIAEAIETVKRETGGR